MRGLLSSELLRFRSRRLVVVLLGAALGGSAVGAAIAASQSTPPTDTVRAEARAAAAREFRACMELEFEEPELGRPLEEYCRDHAGDQTQYMPSHLALVQLPAILQGVSSLLIIFGLLIGSSVVAASWQTGTIGTILSWEPRRARWFAARLLVVGLGVAVSTIAIVVFLSLALAAAAALRGSTILTDGWWADVGVTGLRVAAAAAAAAVIGGAIAAVGRHTAAALGVVFVWSAVLEGVVRALRPLWSPWLLGENAVAFLSWKTMEFQAFPAGSYTITPAHAVVVILGYTAVVVALGFTFVGIRDVE